MNLFVMFPSMSLKHLKPQSNTINPITHNTFRHCRVRFCWITFLETAVYCKDSHGYHMTILEKIWPRNFQFGLNFVFCLFVFFNSKPAENLKSLFFLSFF